MQEDKVGLSTTWNRFMKQHDNKHKIVGKKL